MACTRRLVTVLLLLLVVTAGAAHALPAATGASTSAAAQDVDQLVDKIRQRVIDELGLTQAVVRNATDDEIESVMHEYRRLLASQNQRDVLDDVEEEATIEIPCAAQTPDLLQPRRRGRSVRRPRQTVLRATFARDGSALWAPQHITGGWLQLWLGAARRRRRRPAARLSLHRVLPGRSRRLASQPLADTAGWVTFNVSSLAERWSARQTQQLVLELRCDSCGRRLAGAAPRLLLRQRRARRVRRAAGDFLGQTETMRSGSPVDCVNSHDKKCCRQKMEVNFKELGGFEQILQPASFQAYHCRGGCPASYNVANDHALLQGWIHQKHQQGIKNMPHAHAPCCAPSKLSALPIVHYDAQGKVRITYWENVVVEECRCS